MPVYLLSVCYPADLTQPEPDALDVIMRDVERIHDEQQAAGAWIFGGGLAEASAATTVLDQDGDVVLTDGPFIESKEQIGGFSIVRAEDLDEALAWGRKLSAATRTPIEVRPFQPGSSDRSERF